jgi:hypothetical protein
MGVVYKALDQDVVNGQRVGPIQVALKIVNSDKEGGTDSVEALKNEGSVVFKLRHKNIVEMYSAERDGATWFLTMELLRGNRRIDHRAPPERGRAAGIPAPDSPALRRHELRIQRAQDRALRPQAEQCFRYAGQGRQDFRLWNCQPHARNRRAGNAIRPETLGRADTCLRLHRDVVGNERGSAG